jgi:putative membrane protein
VLVLLGAVLLLPVLVGGLLGFGPGMTGMWDGGMWGTGQPPGWMVLAGVVVRLVGLAVVVGVGYLLYRALADGDESDQALEELRLAYARGDLSDEEYEQRRETLQRDT